MINLHRDNLLLSIFAILGNFHFSPDTVSKFKIFI